MPDVVLDEWVLIRALEAEHPADGLERESADLLAVVQTSHRCAFTPCFITEALELLAPEQPTLP